jgi:hypothetical protein
LELSPALLGLLGTLFLAIGALIGVVVNARLKREENVYTRLERVEAKEAKCQADLFELRTDMQTMWLALELILKEYPQVESHVMDATIKIKARQREFLHRTDASGGQGAEKKG